LVYQTKPLGTELHFRANFFLLWCEINMAAGHVRKRSKRVCYKQFEN